MIQITVPEGQIVTRHSKPESPRQWTMHFQTVWGHFVDRNGVKDLHPSKFDIVLDTDEKGAPIVYAPGDYFLNPNSLYLQDGRLAVFARLKPLGEAKAKLEAAGKS